MAGSGSWRRIAVVLVVVLAGCSAAPGPGGTETRTVTPAPVPEARGFAPGVTAGGMNASTVLATHKARLANRSYTLTTTLSIQNRSTRTTQWRERTVTRVAASQTPFATTTNYSEPRPYDDVVRTALYYDGTTTRRSVTANGTVSFERFDHQTTSDLTNADLLGNVFYQLTGLQVRRGASGATVVSGTVRYPRLLPTPPNVQADGQATVSIRIGQNGIVERTVVGYDGWSDGGLGRVRLVTRVTDLGSTTVERPLWTNASATDA